MKNNNDYFESDIKKIRTQLDQMKLEWQSIVAEQTLKLKSNENIDWENLITVEETEKSKSLHVS
jgi:hypothetical protein